MALNLMPTSATSAVEWTFGNATLILKTADFVPGIKWTWTKELV